MLLLDLHIIEEVRDKDPVFVFTYKGNPLARMNNSAWKRGGVYFTGIKVGYMILNTRLEHV
jgi:hypothetical protein